MMFKINYEVWTETQCEVGMILRMIVNSFHNSLALMLQFTLIHNIQWI